MADGTITVLGIPLPSTDPLFLGVVGIHIAFGLSAVGTGLVAMLSGKGRGRHSNFGTIYFWSLAGLFVTTSVLSFLRWSEDYHLFLLGTLSFGAAFLGRLSIRRRSPRLHLSGMASSYILMLTAFYVDNGKNLPVWRDLPHIAYWIVPGAIGLPLAVYYLFRLPRITPPLESPSA
jgi:hypothetical protein